MAARIKQPTTLSRTNRAFVLSALMLFVAPQDVTFAAGSSFTFSYGGRLTEANGRPVEGPVSLSVAFYRTATGGSPVLTVAEGLTAVPLQEGMFQVSLTLSGSDMQAVFTSVTDSVYVEITDLTNRPDNPYDRQLVSMVPYAAKVPVDGSTIGYDANGQLTVNAANLDLSSNPMTGVQLSDNDGTANTVQIKAPSNVASDVTYTLPATPDAGKFLTTDAGGNLTWTTPAGSGDVSTGGQNGAITIGTNDANALTLETNNSPQLTIDATGNVGIGTTSPGQKLSVDGTFGILEGGATPQYYTIFQGGDQGADITYTLPVAAPAADGYVLSATQAGVMSWIAPGGSSNPGAGTSSEHFGASSTSAGNSASSFGNAASAAGNSATALGAGASAGFQNSIALGAGATTTATNQLVIGNNISSVYLGNGVTSATPNSVAINVTGGSAGGVNGANLTLAAGKGGAATDTGGNIVFQTTGAGAGGATLTDRMTIAAGGNIGIDDSTPDSTLDVNGTIRALELCDENGGNCKDISAGWSGGVAAGGQTGALTLGTNDANSLTLETNNTSRMSIDSAGVVTFQDATASTGATTVIVKSGAGQSSTNLFEARAANNDLLFNINPYGDVIAKNDRSFYVGSSNRLGDNGVTMSSTSLLRWTNGANAYDTADTGIERQAAGVAKVTNGSGTLATLAAGTVGIGTTGPTYSLHVAPTNATAGQTAFFQDAKATTGSTSVVVKAGAGQGTGFSDGILDVQDSTGSSLFRVTNNYGVIFNSLTAKSGGLVLNGNYGAGTGYDLSVHNSGMGARTNTSGDSGTLELADGFAPTSGTGTYNALLVKPEVNQTGGANGVSRAIFVNPTLTAAADFRAIETVSGNVVFGSTSGNVGIGDTTPDSALDVNGTIRALEICDENGANCKDISAGWSGGSGDVTSGGQNGALTLGTNDNTTLTLESNNVSRMTINGSGTVTFQDPTATSGVTNVIVKSGAGQSTTPPFTVQDGAGNPIFKVGSNGVAYSDQFSSIGAYMTFTVNAPSNINSGALYDFGHNNGLAYTSGETDQIKMGTWGFTPPSGTAVHNTLRLSPTIDQSSGATGVTRGLYVNPSLTSAADFRAIETTKGNVIIGSTSGNVGIGTTSPDGRLDVEPAAGSVGVKIGATVPLYLGSASYENEPYIGFNLTESGGSNVYGAGSASKYAAKLEFSPGSGDLTWGVTASSGNAGSAATVSWPFRITRDGKVGLGNSVVPVNGLDVGSNAAIGNTYVYSQNAAPTNGLIVEGNTGIGTNSPTAKLDVNSNTLRLRTAKTPATSTAACDQGEIAWDASYIYVCVATNTWKRVAIGGTW